METTSHRYRFWLFGAALACGAAYAYAWWTAAHAASAPPTGEALAAPLDDDAIYFQYARQALDGHWFRYQPGAPISTGVTSILYFLLLTALMGLGLAGTSAALLLGILALLLGLVCADRVSRRLFPRLPGWWAGALLLAQGSWVAAHFNGLETGLELGLTWGLLDALTLENAPWAAPWLAMVALAFTRPEGQVIAAVLGLSWAWPKPGRLGGVLLASAAPTLFLLALSGSPVPDSSRPKLADMLARPALDRLADASTFAMGALKGVWMGFWGGADAVGTAGDGAAGNPVGPLFPPLALLGALLGCWSLGRGAARVRRFGPAALAALALLLALLAWNLPVGWHQHRYLEAAAPLLLLGMLGALDVLAEAPRPLGASLPLALFSLWVAFGLASWPWHLKACSGRAADYACANTRAALNLRSVPPGPLAVVDSGLLAYYSGRPVVDLPGITDHALALANRDGGGAVLKELLHRPEQPLWAALHDGRPDGNVTAFQNTGLLNRVGPLAPGMSLYSWDWSGRSERLAPYALPKGASPIAAADLAYRADESAYSLAFGGSDSSRTLAARKRLTPGGPQIPEAGRKVAWLAFGRLPQGTRALLVRGTFDRSGRLSLVDSGGAEAASLSIGSTPAETYSEELLELAPGALPPLTLVFHPSDAPQSSREFAAYRVWYLDGPGR
jgi:hypothetical protein